MVSVEEHIEVDDLYTVEVAPVAAESLRSILKANRKLIVEAIDELEVDPRPAESVKLTGSAEIRASNLRRLVVGDFRIVYGINERTRTVTIELVRHRGLIYTLLDALVLKVKGKYSP